MRLCKKCFNWPRSPLLLNVVQCVINFNSYFLKPFISNSYATDIDFTPAMFFFSSQRSGCRGPMTITQATWLCIRTEKKYIEKVFASCGLNTVPCGINLAVRDDILVLLEQEEKGTTG